MGKSRFLSIGKISSPMSNGQHSQFEINKSDSKGAKAEKVKLPGGKKVSCERDDREVDEENSYVGTVKFFAGQNGFGFIIPDEEIEFMGETVTTDAEAEE